MKKLIFAGLVVLLGTACTSSGGFDGSAHSAGGSTAGVVAKVGEAAPGTPSNPIEATPSTPDYVEVRNPVEGSPENPVEPDWDGDHGWDAPHDDGGMIGEVKPPRPKPENPIEPDEPKWGGDLGWGNPDYDFDGDRDWGQDRPSDNPPSDDGGAWQSVPTDNIPGRPKPDNDRPHDDNGDGTENGGIDTGWGQERPSENPPRVSVDDRMERTPDNDTPGHGENERPSIERPIERERPSDNRESNRRDRDHSRDRNGNATGRSVDGRARVGHF